MKDSKKKKRVNYTMKLMYALGILFVVSGHVVKTGGISLFYEWFPPYSFHLALFAFCSGYFYEEKNENEVGTYIIKKIKKFIVPLYVWNFIYGLFVLITHQFGFSIGANFSIYNLLIMPIVHGMKFHYNLASWFLMSLFLVQVVYIVLRKIVALKKHKELILIIIFSILGFLGIYLARNGYNKGLYLTLVRVLYFLPFYATGYIYNKVLEKKDTLSNRVYFLLIMLGSLLVVGLIGYYPKYTPSSCHDFKNGILTPFIVGYLGIFFWLRISKILTPYFGKNKYVNILADNTLPIVFHQFLGFMTIKSVFAIGHKFFGLFNDFSMLKFKSDIWYYYMPYNNTRFLILYVIAGLIIPIILARLYGKIKARSGYNEKK